MDYIKSVVPESVPVKTIVCCSAVAVGVIGGIVAYKTWQSSAARLDSYNPPPKPPRLHKQKFKFVDDLFDVDDAGDDEDDDNENNLPFLLIIHQAPRGRRVPCVAPFALKLETYLRIHRLRYEVDFQPREPRNIDSPYITLQYEDVMDAKNCFDYICDEYGIDPDEFLTEEARAKSRAYISMIENHLYFGIALYRYSKENAEKLRSIQFLPPEAKCQIPKVRDAVTNSAWHHGIGKLDQKSMIASIIEDIESLSIQLGKKEFFFEEAHPSELDCAAFGMLAQILWTMDGSAYYDAINYRFTNLKDFCWRMRKTFWPDWDKCLHNIPWTKEDDYEEDYYI